jgi:predicted MFS family arabinose efflux permease
VLSACWAVAPFVGYWALLVLASVANLFLVPSFSVVRQALMHAVPDDLRISALAVDSVVVEISYMIGPALGVLLATYCDTAWALFGCEFASIAGGVLLWFADPALRVDEIGAIAHTTRIREWITAHVLAVCVMVVAGCVVLTGTDVGVVAALRYLHHQSWIGWELGIWGLGSAIGGATYGLLHRRIPVPFLLILLSAATLPIILARNAWEIAVLLLVAGLFCAPTIASSVEAVSRSVPERVRGEALGWHGSAITAGSAIGSPVAGFAIDKVGWHGGFVLPSIVGLVTGVLGLLTLRRSRTGVAAAATAVPESV